MSVGVMPFPLSHCPSLPAAVTRAGELLLPLLCHEEVWSGGDALCPLSSCHLRQSGELTLELLEWVKWPDPDLGSPVELALMEEALVNYPEGESMDELTLPLLYPDVTWAVRRCPPRPPLSPAVAGRADLWT